MFSNWLIIIFEKSISNCARNKLLKILGWKHFKGEKKTNYYKGLTLKSVAFSSAYWFHFSLSNRLCLASRNIFLRRWRWGINNHGLRLFFKKIKAVHLPKSSSNPWKWWTWIWFFNSRFHECKLCVWLKAKTFNGFSRLSECCVCNSFR